MKAISEKITGMKDEMYQNRLKIALEAFQKGCVVFCEETQRLYTPREFLESMENVSYRKIDTKEYANCTLMYPKAAISRQMEISKKAQEDLQSLIGRMLNAFELHPIEKKTKKPG